MTRIVPHSVLYEALITFDCLKPKASYDTIVGTTRIIVGLYSLQSLKRFRGQLIRVVPRSVSYEALINFVCLKPTASYDTFFGTNGIIVGPDRLQSL